MLHNIKQIKKIKPSQPQYVYDIQMVDEPHNFFANDILVHNSLFVHYGDQDSKQIEQGVKQFREHYRDSMLAKHNKDILQQYYIMQLQIEKHLSHIFFGDKKKRYYGIEPNGKVYTHGLNTIGKQCPLFLRDKLTNIFEKIVKQEVTVDDILNLRYQVQNTPLIQIAVFKRFNQAFSEYKVRSQILKGAQ